VASDSVTLTQYVLGLEAIASGLEPDVQIFFGTDGMGDIELYVPTLAAHGVDGPPPEVIDQLLGFDAPPHWTALAVSSGATVRSLDDPTQATRARLTFAIDRSGRLASHLTSEHPLPVEAIASQNSEEIEGFLVALVRRVLGLSNRAIVGGIFEWWNSRWLVAIRELIDHLELSGTARQPEQLTVAELLVLHPGIGREIDVNDDPADLIGEARTAALDTTWEELRSSAAAGVEGWISPELAQWCDDAVFATLAMRDWPPAVSTIEVLEAHLSQAVCRHIAELVAIR